MHVLITGGAGFIGSHLAEYHLNRGDDVYVVDNLSTGQKANVALFRKNPRFQFEVADILTWSGINKTVPWADRIYHMAAVVGVYRVLENPVDVLATNIAGCERLLRAIAARKSHVPTLIASTSEVYGTRVQQPLHETDPMVFRSTDHNRGSYAISKLADESFGLAYANKLHEKISIVRLFNTIGPRQTGRYGMVVPRFVEQALSGKTITVYGDGQQTRSFCDVRDTIAILDQLLSNDHSIGEIVNVGHDREISIHDLALLIKTLAKSDSPIQFLTYKEAYGEEIDETVRRQPCLKKLQNLISYQYQWTLEDTIQDLIQKYSLKP